MMTKLNKRDVLVAAGASIGGFGLACGFLGSGSAHAASQGGILGMGGRDGDDFSRIVRASSGAASAMFSDYAVQSPEGQTCSARLTYPVSISKKLPVLIFFPDEGARAGQYDLLTAALAAQDYFVISIDRRPTNAPAARNFLTTEQQSDASLRRFAEARFLLDTIDAAAAVLGANAQMVDASRIGAFGHGDGAWVAAGLGGWDNNGGANTRTRDGRVYAIFGLTPTRTAPNRSVPAQRSPDGVSGMFAGILDQMPVPAKDSGLLGLGLPLRSNSFGGLIGQVSAAEARRLTPERQTLAAAIASSVLFFDWTLRSDNDSKRELMALDGRMVDGLNMPLALRKA
jgi:hypothetical protein